MSLPKITLWLSPRDSSKTKEDMTSKNSTNLDEENPYPTFVIRLGFSHRRYGLPKIKFWIYSFVALLLLATYDHSLSAEITSTKDTWGDPLIEIRGEIKRGDLEKIQMAAANVATDKRLPLRHSLQFHINTPGGDVTEAMKIGRFFRNILASVDSYGNEIVATGSEEEQVLILDKIKKDQPKESNLIALPKNALLKDENIVRNYSAGVLIFFGAVKRTLRDNIDRRSGLYRKIPVIGIHRPYFSKDYYAKLSPSEAQKAYRALETSVRHYMSEMGAPQSLIDRIFIKASNEIELIPEDEFRHLYKEEASFLQEWLIAKCGSSSPPYGLSATEFADFQDVVAWQSKARLQDSAASEKPFHYIYPNPNFPTAYLESLYEKVRTYNSRVSTCRNSAVVNHQIEWAKKWISTSRAR